MKRKKIFIFTLVALLALVPVGACYSAEFPQYLLGRVVVDVSAHGEAWYVNPQTRMRVFLGTPQEAVGHLSARAFFVNYSNIARIAPEDGGGESERPYLNAVAGFVMAPNDLIGAAWYVDPAKGVRRRLVTSDDAWHIMRDGVSVRTSDITMIPVEPLDSPHLETGHVAEVLSGDTVKLDDGREVRLISVSVPSNPELQEAAKSRLKDLLAGREVVMECDAKNTDAGGRLLRFLHVADTNVNLDLVRRGLAFDDVGYPNLAYGEQMIVARLDAARNRSGLWKGL